MPGLSQSPIPPGGVFRYHWTADEYGTYWYHSHEKSQIFDGLFGPINVRPAPKQPTPFHMISNNSQDLAAMQAATLDPHLVTLADWSHYTSTQFYRAQEKADVDIFCVNSILINGRGAVNCLSEEEYQDLASPGLLYLLNGTKITDQGCLPPIQNVQGPYPLNPAALPPGLVYGCNATQGSRTEFKVRRKERWAALSFIGAASILAPVVSIDSHPMWIYAVDGHFITPQLVDGFQILNGERYSALVRLDKPAKDYTIRISNANDAQFISGYASLSYAGSTGPAKTRPYFGYNGVNTTASVTLFDTSLTPPYPALPPAATSDLEHRLNIFKTTRAYTWTLSGQASYPMDWKSYRPLLDHPNSPAAHNSSLVIRTRNATWVDIIVESQLGSPQHPIHKHGNKGYYLGSGSGNFTWSSVAEAIAQSPESFNLETAAYRDGFTTLNAAQGPTWMVIRYQVTNPGAWLLHCHIQTHFAGGMGVAILDGVDVFPKVPSQYAAGGNGF